MTITVKYFGLVADITQKKEEQLSFESEGFTLKQLQSKLEEQYAELKNTTYSFAVNQSLTQSNEVLKNKDEIALLPPFAGG